MEITELKRFWNDIVVFQPSEKRAVTAVLIMGIIVLGISNISPKPRSIPLCFSSSDTLQLAEKYLTSENRLENNGSFIRTNMHNQKEFNPNKASKEELISFGLSGKVANTVVNYRNKGGKFYKKEDLKKIYGLSSKDYARLEPYIQIETKVYSKERNSMNQMEGLTQSIPRGAKTIEINLGTIEDFEKLYGIGKYLANKIVNFRNKLGGFYSVDQIGETYGLADSTFQSIKDQLICTNPNVLKLNVNIASYEELEAHPYISKYLAEEMIKFREKNRKFIEMAQIEQLKNIKGDFRKIIPYLTF